MKRLALFPLVLAATSMPAGAHEAPLAFLEAMESHLLDCPNSNGYAPDGDMLSLGWQKYEMTDPLLLQREKEFLGERTDPHINVNNYRKEAEGLELIQIMAAKTTVVEGADQNKEKLENEEIAETTLVCTTLIPDLPFMPGTKLMEAVFGKEVEISVINSPNDTRVGVWDWIDISPTHLRTIAQYTDNESAERLLPDRILYRGFYITSLRRFTPEHPNQESDTE